MEPRSERLALQVFVLVAGLVPVTTGLGGIVIGEYFLALSGPPAALTHAVYLSGLLLGIGLAFWSCIPAIEKHVGRFTLLTAIVFVGGLARLWATFRSEAFAPIVWFALFMELVLTPALWLWQHRITALFTP